MIEQGIPVILRSGSSFGFGGHAMVAYDYDSVTDSIYVHMGWNSGTTHVNVLSYGYDLFWDATALVMNTGHTCANNFKYSDEYNTVQTHCVCELGVRLNYDINYSNITFNGEEVDVYDEANVSYAPIVYNSWQGLDLQEIRAFRPSDSPYSPHWIFLGWYTSMAFTQKVTEIAAGTSGAVTLYAKWRYDYTNMERGGEYTINSAYYNSNAYDDIYIGMNDELYNELSGKGITKLAIKLKMHMWEISDGYQEIIISTTNNPSPFLLGYAAGIYNYDYGLNYTNSTPGVVEWVWTINLSDLRNINYLYVFYGAHGYGDNTWKNDRVYMELSYVVTQTDINSPEFFWSYQDPFD